MFEAEVGIETQAALAIPNYLVRYPREPVGAVFQVSVDGTTRFTSGVIQSGQRPLPVRVDVSGARTLTLTVEPDQGNEPFGLADWLNARLMGGAAVPEPGPR